MSYRIKRRLQRARWILIGLCIRALESIDTADSLSDVLQQGRN